MQVQPGILDYSTGTIRNENDLFIDNSGRIIKGSKAYLNDEKFNLTINPTFESEQVDDKYSHNKIKPKKFKRIYSKVQQDIWDYNYEGEDEVKGIFLSCSLPRLLSNTNLKTLSIDEQKTALNNLQSRLKEYGIKTNIYNANLSRLDTFTNISTDHIFYAYSNLFSLMECSRMKSAGWGEETFLWKNGNQELTVYDKVREMMKKAGDWFLKERRNVLRIENRLLKKRKIETAIKFKTVGELFKNYDELKSFHKKEVEKKIFRYSYDDIEFMTENDLKQKFIYSKTIYGKKWFDKYCFNLGVWTVSKSINIDWIKDLIEELDEGTPGQIRVKKHRIKKLIEDAKFHFGKGGVFSDELVNFKSNVELYNELKTKFYKQVV